MAYQSHIQNTKSIFKGFIDEKTKKLYVLDLKNNRISLSSPKKIGTEKEYYYEHNEKGLNNIIDSAFGKVLSKIRDFVGNNIEKLTFSKDEVKAIVNFSFFLVFRSSKFLKEGRDTLYTKDLYDDKTTHNHFIELSLLYAQKKTLPKELRNMTFNLLCNKTVEDFITSKNGFCEVNCNKVYVFLIPIGPKTAIIVFDKNNGLNNEKSLPIDNLSSVNEINKAMFDYEIKYNNDFVVAKKKETLVNIIN